MDIDEKNIYESLTKSEQAVLNKILKEISDTGKSDTFNRIWYEDYEEIPVDIYTFITSDLYIGKFTNNGKSIYPYWINILKHIFHPSSKYFECIFTGSIGQGKTTIAIVGIAYIIYRLMCLRNPQTFYGLTPGSKIVIAFFNVSLDMSYSVAFSKLQSMLKMSPWFLQRGTVRGLKDEVYIPGKSIEFRLGSNELHGLGQDIFCLSGDTKVCTDKGVFNISQLENQFTKFLSYDILNNKLIESYPSLVINSGYTDEIYELELEDGTIIKCTENHKFLTNNGYKSIKDITIMDELVNM